MYSTEQRRLAIETFIRFDHSYADTIAELGCPDRHTLNSWWREYRETGEVPVGKMIREPRFSDGQKREAVEHCPGQRKYRGPNPKRDPVPIERKVQVIAELEARTEPAAEIAEKAAMVTALRPRWKLCEVLPVVVMAKSSYEYARSAQAKGETEGHAAARKAVIEASGASGGTYGYRRIYAQASADAEDGAAIGEWTVRSIMEEDLVARAAKKKRRYSSYEGEISEAPTNLLRDDRGRHHFRSNKPNELWITDMTEFRIPAGKAYLPPIVDCSDGMPLSWPVSTSPDAEMENSSLLGACKWLNEGDHPKIHSDRGCHYRWPGWIRICDENGLARSMPGKGCSPDSARCEGFFGRLKIEFFHGCDWAGVTIEKFMDMLDAYLRWYRDERIKSNLGYRSPAQYRRDLGLAA